MSVRRAVLVTGATGTVGRAVAERLSTDGWTVVVHGVRPAAVGSLVDELGADRTIPFLTDLTDVAGTESGLRALAATGVEFEAVVNAAGEFGPIANLVDISATDWRRVIELDLGALITLIRTLVPGMIERGRGRVIQIGSAAARATPGRGNAPYSVSKAAADRLLAHLAAESASTGVTVHSVHPGEIASRMWRHIATAAAAAPDLGGYADWAEATRAAPDDPARVGALVAALLDEVTAARLDGCFLFAQRPGWDPQPLA